MADQAAYNAGTPGGCTLQGGTPPPPLPCSQTCSGCCDANDVCQSGTSVSACGAGGVSCSACGANEACSGNCQKAPPPVVDSGAPPPPEDAGTVTPPSSSFCVFTNLQVSCATGGGTSANAGEFEGYTCSAKSGPVGSPCNVQLDYMGAWNGASGTWQSN